MDNLELRLVRRPSNDKRTHGDLFVGDKWACFTLEDPERPQKIAGITAIPAGRYRVDITASARFGRPMPLLLSVPGFTGIRLHPGNKAEDTDGCILVGMLRGVDSIYKSRVAYDTVFSTMQSAIAKGREVWITIESAQELAA